MHERCPWIVTWDDHEVANDYASEFSEEPVIQSAKFLARRAAAYQAYYENMPLRAASLPHGPDMQLYRNSSFGKLADFFVLDTRQYRTDQPYAGEAHGIDDLATTPKATILGSRQMNWLESALANSQSGWNVLAQQVLMATVDCAAGADRACSMEKWSGYLYERQRLLQFIADRQIKNPVVLTGDIHSNWVNDLRVDDWKLETPVVATELVGTSIASGKNGEDLPAEMKSMLAENPFVKFHNQQRGYVSCTVTPAEWRSDFRIVEDVERPGAPVRTRASFVMESGRPGAQQA
jgi:alkaline phosphatase D